MNPACPYTTKLRWCCQKLLPSSLSIAAEGLWLASRKLPVTWFQAGTVDAVPLRNVVM